MDILSRTIPISGYGLCGLSLLVLVGIPFVLARPPRSSHPADLHEATGNLMWYLVFFSCLIVALALAGEAAGLDTIPNFGPR